MNIFILLLIGYSLFAIIYLFYPHKLSDDEKEQERWNNLTDSEKFKEIGKSHEQAAHNWEEVNNTLDKMNDIVGRLKNGT